MKYKKIMLILITTIFLVSIASVCAADANDTAIASDDIGEIELSQTDNLETTEKDIQLTQANNDEVVSAENDLDTLGTNSGNYSGLVSEIGSGGNIILQYDYYIYDYGSTINITAANSVIDGNEAVIDMVESNIKVFSVTASDVTFKNLTIENSKYDGNNGAIKFSEAGTVINFNFSAFINLFFITSTENIQFNHF